MTTPKFKNKTIQNPKSHQKLKKLSHLSLATHT